MLSPKCAACRDSSVLNCSSPSLATSRNSANFASPASLSPAIRGTLRSPVRERSLSGESVAINKSLLEVSSFEYTKRCNCQKLC